MFPSIAAIWGFQFTPLREGRPVASLETLSISRISIHAPPRGATQNAVKAFQKANNFNSRPSARGDGGRGPPFIVTLHFNSRPSARGDSASTLPNSVASYFNSRPSARGDGGSARVGKSRNISIHAPPRGATCSILLIDIRFAISIHAPPRGATGLQSVRTWADRFQFTPLREGRRQGASKCIAKFLFQFTPLREGRQCFFQLPTFDRLISIHAPPRGATALWQGGHAPSPISIHAPPRGATLLPNSRICQKLHFNSRPSARGDWKVAAA